VNDSKILIAFFSRPGSNYVQGNLQDLLVGNTEQAAHMLQKVTRGELFKIEALEEYPADYYETTELAKKELRENARPVLKQRLETIEMYQTIVLAYPNWWGTMPMPVYTFLQSYDFAHKTLVPLCTHEGSGMGQSEDHIRRLCPQATLLSGLSIMGGAVAKAENSIMQWLSMHQLIE